MSLSRVCYAISFVGKLGGRGLNICQHNEPYTEKVAEMQRAQEDRRFFHQLSLLPVLNPAGKLKPSRPCKKVIGSTYRQGKTDPLRC